VVRLGSLNRTREDLEAGLAGDCLCSSEQLALTARGLVTFVVGARPTNTSGPVPGN
jgi:hypothetical protein